MAVPSAVTLDEIVTEALKRAGRTTPSAAVIASAKAQQFREVKSEMEQIFDVTLPELYGELGGATIIGETTLALPTSNVQAVESIRIYEPGTDDGWDDTLQAATSTTMTMAAALNEDTEKMQGRYVYFDGGTGSGQLVQMGEYNNTTKVSPITGTFETTPDNTTTYVIASDREHTIQEDLILQSELDVDLVRGRPTCWASVWANPGSATDQDDVVRSIRWNIVPDKVYPVRYVVRYAMDWLDESGTLLTTMLRRYRAVWIQGIAAYSMQLYDEDRFFQTYQIYRDMLEKLSAKYARIYHMSYNNL